MPVHICRLNEKYVFSVPCEDIKQEAAYTAEGVGNQQPPIEDGRPKGKFLWYDKTRHVRTSLRNLAPCACTIAKAGTSLQDKRQPDKHQHKNAQEHEEGGPQASQ